MNIDVRGSLSGPHDHRIAWTLSIAFVLFSCAIAPFARLPLAPIPASMGLVSGAGFVALAASAYLLAVKARASRARGLGAMAASFAAASVTVGLWGLSFPGAFDPVITQLHARPECTIWLSFVWRAWVLAGIFAYRFRLPTPSLGLVALVTVVAAAFVMYVPLPHLAMGGVMEPLFTYGFGPLFIAAGLTAAAMLGRTAGTSLDPWLRLVAIAVVCDLVLVWAGGARYSAGWYASRLFGVIAPAILLCVLMLQIARLYGEIAHEAAFHKHNADTDPLTNIPNRRRFENEAALAIDRAHRYARPLSIAMIDVDRFKRFNDQFGHLAGDDALRTLGDLLQTQLNRPGDLVARYGGEEFVILFDATECDGAVAAVERVRAELLMRAIPHPSSPSGVVSFSAGIATLHPGESLLDLLDRADMALYAAKREGRDRICRGESRLSVA